VPGKTLVALAAAALLWSCLLCGHSFRLGLAAGGTAVYLFFAVVLLGTMCLLVTQRVIILG